jgi:hypothetical protein
MATTTEPGIWLVSENTGFVLPENQPAKNRALCAMGYERLKTGEEYCLTREDSE